jgi:hypothetical protein
MIAEGKARHSLAGRMFPQLATTVEIAHRNTAKPQQTQTPNSIASKIYPHLSRSGGK